jgi:hypothetical protein
MLLRYVERSAFEWNVHYSSAQEYKESLKRVNGLIEHLGAGGQDSSSYGLPVAREAASVLQEIGTFDEFMVQQPSTNDPSLEELFIDGLARQRERPDNDIIHSPVGEQHGAGNRVDAEVSPLAHHPVVPVSPTIGAPTPVNENETEIASWDEINSIFPELGVWPMDVCKDAEHDQQGPAHAFAATEVDTVMRGATPAPPQPDPIRPIATRQVRPALPSRSPSAFVFPTSEFARHRQLSKQDGANAQYILNKFKVLAIAQDARAASRGRRYSLEGEKAAIMAMPLDTSLSIGSTPGEALSVSEMLRRAFARYDGDQNGNPISPQQASARSLSGRTRSVERIERALLMLAVVLLRHKYMYVEPHRNSQDGKRVPGQHYALDFDRHIPPSSMSGKPAVHASVRRPSQGNALLRRARALSRIVVACGHPSIVVVLVRLSVRLGMRLVALLDELPIDALCNWLSYGSVTSSRLTVSPRELCTGLTSRAERLEADLKWLHGHVLLPLLAVAAKRIPDTFAMFDGRVQCSADACLAAIVPHALQTKYLDFREGQYRDDQWSTGRIPLTSGTLGGTRSLPHIDGDERVSPSSEVSTPQTIIEDDWEAETTSNLIQHNTQYSIPTDHRTFARYAVPSHAEEGDLFDPPPAFLVNQILTLVDDVW